MTTGPSQKKKTEIHGEIWTTLTSAVRAEHLPKSLRTLKSSLSSSSGTKFWPSHRILFIKSALGAFEKVNNQPKHFQCLEKNSRLFSGINSFSSFLSKRARRRKKLRKPHIFWWLKSPRAYFPQHLLDTSDRTNGLWEQQQGKTFCHPFGRKKKKGSYSLILFSFFPCFFLHWILCDVICCCHYSGSPKTKSFLI